MSTRAVTRSYLAAFTLISATAIFACSSGTEGDGTGGGGGGDTGGGGGDTGGGGGENSGMGGGEAGSGGSPATGGSGGNPATGGTTPMTGGKGGAPGTGGMAMGGMMTGTGGTPVAASFPCQANCKVLVVGDGLAAGSGSGANGADGAGYRTVLMQGLGAKFSIVGSMGSPAHEGMKGRKVDAMLTALPGFITTHKPDLIVLSIGSEDFRAGTAGLPAKAMAVVDKATELAPNAGVLVTGVSAFSGANLTNLQKYNNDFGKLVNAKATAGKHVRYVGLAAVFCSFGCSGVESKFVSSQAVPYPNALGYKEIADLLSSPAKALMGL